MFEGHEEDRSLEHNKWFYSGGGHIMGLIAMVMGLDSYSR